MTRTGVDPDFLGNLRAKYEAQGAVFWASDHELALFDADDAVRANEINFADLTLPDRLVDLLRRRRSHPVSWRQVRAAWLRQLRELSRREPVLEMYYRMAALLDRRLDQETDLTWLMHSAVIEGLLPVVIRGIPARAATAIRHDLTVKLTRLLSAGGPPQRRRLGDNPILTQVRAALAVRREIRARAAGRRPRRTDLTDPIAIELLPQLGMDRAVDAVTAVLTAISGPPGASAAALLFELTNQPQWTDRLIEEQARLTPGELAAAPLTAAPLTHRFLKEVLRVWTAPLMLSRGVRVPIPLEHHTLQVGQRFLLSPYMIHHDPACWSDADTFDPDRWLPDAPHGPISGAHYVPFGWAPKSCVGAGLGTIQLIMLCHLLCTRYRVEVQTAEAMRMVLAAVPTPTDFRGLIRRR